MKEIVKVLKHHTLLKLLNARGKNRYGEWIEIGDNDDEEEYVFD